MKKQPLQKALKYLIFIVAYFLVGKFSLNIHRLAGYYPMVWLPSGVGLSLLIVGGISFWPLILLAAFILGFSENIGIGTSMVLAIASTIECILGAYLQKRFSGPARPKLTTVRETLVFIVFAMGVSTFLGSGLAFAGLYLLGDVSLEKIYFTWKLWWLSDAMGDLIIGVAFVFFAGEIKARTKIHRRNPFEFCLACLCVATAATFIYTPLSRFNTSLIIRPYFLFPLMIWSAIRFDTLGVVMINFAVMAAMVIGGVYGILPQGPGTLEDRMFVHQLVAMTIGMTGLVLAAAIREKEDALEVKSEFLNIASHELKTPITSLKLQYDLFMRKFGGARPPEIPTRLFLNKIGKQLNRLTHIVEQLLNTARLENETLQLNNSTERLSVLLDNVLNSMAEDLAAAGSKTTIDVKKDPLVNWDFFRMEQVLSNIFSNAIKYAPGKPINVSITDDEQWAHIAVRDHGPGVDPLKKDLIFKRFVRATDPSKTDGLGLGLFISQEIVAAHGGHIKVENTDDGGGGATFKISLPLTKHGFPTIS